MSKFDELINGETPVLIDFHATWCGPCKTLAPIIKEVKEDFGNHLTILKVDVDKNQAIAAKMKIKGVPTLVLYQKGKQLWRQSGVMPANQLIAIVKEHIG